MEVDKDALLKSPELAREIEGIAIGTGEQFEIEPFEAKLSEAA